MGENIIHSDSLN